MDSERLKELVRFSRVKQNMWINDEHKQFFKDAEKVFSTLAVPDSIDECEKELDGHVDRRAGRVWYTFDNCDFSDRCGQLRAAQAACWHLRREALMEGKGDDEQEGKGE